MPSRVQVNAKVKEPSAMGNQAYYRIIVDVNESGHWKDGRQGFRRGFRQIVAICRALAAAQADYVVNWDTPDVLILATIPHVKPKVKRVVHRVRRERVFPIVRPTPEKCRAEMEKIRESFRLSAQKRRYAMLPEELTHATIDKGREWHRERQEQQRLGHGLAKWFAVGADRDYKTLDALFGVQVRRAGALMQYYRGDYKRYLVDQARHRSSSRYLFRPWSVSLPDAKYNQERAVELAYWSEMLKLSEEAL